MKLFQPARFVHDLFSPDFAWAALNTLWISLASVCLGIAIGLILAIAQEARIRPLRWIVTAYVWLFRGTPVLLQLVFAFNVLPSFGLTLSGYTCAVLVLGLNDGAYMAEIMRAGIRAVGPGQRAAARALGLDEFPILRWIVIPQALRIVIPPIGNQFIGMLKLSALVSVIGVKELLLIADQAASSDFHYVESLSAAGLWYLALTTVFMAAQNRIEWAISRRRTNGNRRQPAPLGLATPRDLSPLLDARAIWKRFGASDVLRGVDLAVQPGQCLVLMGPSGSGKSTLLRCLNLLEPITSGSIVFEGNEIAVPSLPRPSLVRRRIGMVFQNFELFQHLSVLDNITLAPVRTKGIPLAEAQDHARRLLLKVHLPGKADAFPDELSGGQQQRVAIARALAMEPALMLYDEPTSALDPETVGEVLRVMQELADDGMTSIVVTHELGFARRAADEVVFMEAGTVLHRSPRDTFFGAQAPERIARYLGQLGH